MPFEMRQLIEIGTDVATIGVWDPAYDRPDLCRASYAVYQSGLESEALAGRLFFINTSADGEYPTAIYVDEEPPEATKALYTAVDRHFLIESQSGTLIASGVEDFVNSRKQISSAADQFAVPCGHYALQLFIQDENRLRERLRTEVGDSDFEYYSAKCDRMPWGCLLLIAIGLAAAALASHLWPLAAFVLFTGVCYSLFVRRIRAADCRFNDIGQRLNVFIQEHPPFLFVLRRVTHANDLQGGWYNLEL